MQEDFLDYEEQSIWELEVNAVSIVLIHRALKQYCELWAGGDPFEQEQAKAVRDSFYRLTLEALVEEVDEFDS